MLTIINKLDSQCQAFLCLIRQICSNRKGILSGLKVTAFGKINQISQFKRRGLKVISSDDIFFNLQDISQWPDIYDLRHRLSHLLKDLSKIMKYRVTPHSIGWYRLEKKFLSPGIVTKVTLFPNAVTLDKTGIQLDTLCLINYMLLY